jgi:tetratricopeptide (TPR) repeat protein
MTARRRRGRERAVHGRRGADFAQEVPNRARARRPRSSRRRFVALGLTVVAAALTAVTLFTTGRRAHERAGITATVGMLPPPRSRHHRDTIAFADFVGAQTCAPCHQGEYAAWARSTHAHAGGPPSPERLLATFDGTPIRFADAIVIPAVDHGVYTFTVRQAGRAPRVLRVDGVVGGGHMVGGGTQGFVSRFPDGTLRFLPFDFIKREGVWFCNTGLRGAPGYHPITPRMRLAECGDWPPRRTLGESSRFATCQGCHGSTITLAFDTASHRYVTRYTTLAIDCESCHGPGRRHVALARSGRIATAADIGMRSLATLPRDAALEVCFRCHSLKDELIPGDLPGMPLAESYSTGLALVGDEPLYPDGRVRTFAYQQNQRYSACYRNGSMTCTSCHDPHSQGYRDIAGTPLSGRFDDRQCTDCHASKAEPIEAHTHHRADSPGSRCVACHMPYLQEPEVGHELRYARSDHTIPIPRPAFDSTLGVEGACRQCHTDRSVSTLEAQVHRWWGSLKPHPPLVSALLRADSTSDPAHLAELLLTPEPDHPLAQLTALGRYVARVIEPNAASLPSVAVRRLEALARHPDLDVQSLALAALHYARGGDPAVHRFLVTVIDSLGPREMPVRRRWAMVLGDLGDRARSHGDAATAILAYRKALEVLPDEPRVLANLALAEGDAGDYAAAVRDGRRSLALDPVQPVTLVNLGNALLAQGDVAGAEEAYRRALAINPREPLATFNLGNLALERRDAAGAIALYERTIELDAGLVPAYLNLARAYALAGDLAPARSALVQALEIDPGNAEAQQMLATLPHPAPTPVDR